MGRILRPEEVLAAVPQREPFRFIDAIHELDDAHIRASYRFRPEADFYRGHFPERPVTPGVLLIEAMAQAGVVALGIYLLALEESPEALDRYLTVFTEASVEFAEGVPPGDTVMTTGRKVFFRRHKLRTEVEMRRADGRVVASGVLAGIGVVR